MTRAQSLVARRIGPADDGRYTALLEDRPEATFFHTRVWARIVTSGFPQIIDESGLYAVDDRTFAVPLFRWRRLGGLVATLHSSFPFLYGGPIPAERAAGDALLRLLARRAGSLVMQGNPFAASAEGAAAEAAGSPPAAVAARSEITHLLRLPESVETYWSEVLTSRKRNDIRRLTKKGVSIELSDDLEDVPRVYALYQQRMASWERRPGLVYPLAFYRAMMKAGEGTVRLYVARYEGRLIGGTFVCRWNRIVHYNAGYFDPAHRALRPNVLIQERIIRDAIEEGFRLYDMLPSAGLESVEQFKESFGGVRTPFPCWRKLGALHRLLFGLRRSLRRRAEGSAS